MLDAAAFPLWSSGLLDSDSDRNWDPLDMIPDALDDLHLYENFGVHAQPVV